MAWYDRIIGRRPQRKLSPLEQWQQTLDTNLIKDARTPVYSGVTPDSGYQEAIMPTIDQFYLEDLADRYSHLRTVIGRIASQSVAKGWEYIDRGQGNDEERKRLAHLLADPSNGSADITGVELMKAMIRQVEIFDDAWVSIVYDYVTDEGGAITGRVVKELWVEDAKHMRFNVDEFGRFRDDEMFDPITREMMEGTHNRESGTKLVPMCYFYETNGENIPFARDEIIHFNKYSASARLYGQSPIIGLANKIETALAIEAWQKKIYRLERPPKGFLDVPGHDEESLNRLGEYIAEETRRNPNFIPIISSRDASTTAKFVPVMPNMDELMMLPYLERINSDINASYGVMPLIVGNIQGVGGLNSEGEQVTIFDRTIRETQRMIEEGFLKPLLKLLDISTWAVRFNDINERNETQRLNNLQVKANILTSLQSAGIEVDIDENGELVFPKTAEVVQQDFPSHFPVSPEAKAPSGPADILNELPENSAE